MIEWFTPSTTIATLTEGENFNFTFSVIGYDTLEFISGSLPPGINFINDNLVGIVGNILNPNEQIFSFTIRAKKENEIVDRDFSIICFPINRQVFWDQSSLPSIRDEFGYYDLGTINIGDLFIWTFNAIDLDEDEITFSYKESSLSTQVDIIPKNINLRSDGYFEGVIQANTNFGIYRFFISIKTLYDNEISLPFKLTILDSFPNTISDLVFIKWLIPDVFEFESGKLSNFQLLVNSSETVMFSLAPGSNSLPNGIILDSQLGYLKGFTFDDLRKEFYVIFRASVGNFYIDKKVLIKIKNDIKLLPNKLYFNISGLQQKRINEIKSSLLLSYLYRLGDEYFNSGDVLINLSNWVDLSDIELHNKLLLMNEVRLIGSEFFIREVIDNGNKYKELVQKLIDNENVLKNYSEKFNTENLEIIWARLKFDSDVLNNVNILRELRKFQGINYVFKQITKTNVIIKPTKFDIGINSATLTYIIDNIDKLLVGPYVIDKIQNVKINNTLVSYLTDAERIYFTNSSGELTIEILVNSETIFDGENFTLNEIKFDNEYHYEGKYFKLRDKK